MSLPKVLAIDDEEAILRIIKDSLFEKFDVVTLTDARDAIAATADELPALILIDNVMPGMSGLEATRTFRQTARFNHVPIIMLTALKSSAERIEAFQAGVDDFISKPFRPDELLTRVESRLERFQSLKAPDSILQIGNLVIIPERDEVRIDGALVHVTHIEYTLIKFLVSHKSKLVARRALKEAVWGHTDGNDKLLDIHMATLRKKIKAFNHPIETAYGKGYVIREAKQ